MSNNATISEGQIIAGPFFNEPMRVETVSAQGSDRWAIGLVGTQTERFRKVTLTAADLEERLLNNVDEQQFRSICQNALEGLATKKLNLSMLIERRARAQECRVVPETIARFIRETAPYAQLTMKEVPRLPHTFDPGRTSSLLRRCESEPDWRIASLVDKVVTSCKSTPQLQAPIKDPARLKWHEVIKVSHYYLSVNALVEPMEVREDLKPYGEDYT